MPNTPAPSLRAAGLCWAKDPPAAPRALSSSLTPDWAPAGMLSSVPQPCSSPQHTLTAPSLCPSSAVGEGRGLGPLCPQHHLGHGATDITAPTGAEPPQQRCHHPVGGSCPSRGRTMRIRSSSRFRSTVANSCRDLAARDTPRGSAHSSAFFFNSEHPSSYSNTAPALAASRAGSGCPPAPWQHEPCRAGCCGTWEQGACPKPRGK